MYTGTIIIPPSLAFTNVCLDVCRHTLHTVTRFAAAGIGMRNNPRQLRKFIIMRVLFSVVVVAKDLGL
jgi:hypothetical protein